MKKFFNAETSSTVIASDAADLVVQVKTAGGTIGKKPAQELWEGKRDNAGGYEFVEDVKVESGVPEEEGKPTFNLDELAKAMDLFKTNGGQVQTEKKPEEAAPAQPKDKVVKVIKASVPKGKIKLVRKDTKIAKGLELLAGGATLEELVGGGIGDDPVDFCNRRVTKRGYGIAVVEGKYSLVFPEGVTSVAYSG